MQEHHLPVQGACRVVRLSRAAFDRPPLPTTRRDAAVIAALTDVVARYPRLTHFLARSCGKRERVARRGRGNRNGESKVEVCVAMLLDV